MPCPARREAQEQISPRDEVLVAELAALPEEAPLSLGAAGAACMDHEGHGSAAAQSVLLAAFGR